MCMDGYVIYDFYEKNKKIKFIKRKKCAHRQRKIKINKKKLIK